MLRGHHSHVHTNCSCSFGNFKNMSNSFKELPNVLLFSLQANVDVLLHRSQLSRYAGCKQAGLSSQPVLLCRLQSSSSCRLPVEQLLISQRQACNMRLLFLISGLFVVKRTDTLTHEQNTVVSSDFKIDGVCCLEVLSGS